ncbi:PTS sugar transporter subunit IIB [Thermosediminibacter oceani]|uniref:Phosphotransferase system lactose/cellobiose-specific IIB subunit n=1 Tax=Thermosediminibacter oceani (strain ATCC BAA-1034 / DSM 16646 / JW/IW-1228P) TaxID=555079 RepID=D9S0C4_THEOJ|nr:PTS sugar transporter subunit IIB [Thermosediminibacter oceani]ADL07052.1 phosphotransferase system lactose/cellobiose-specific IIB subunit [Thermosediminibacter oceani DSM 16646]
MKIVLICFAGMSTSMLVNRMKKAAAKRNIDADIVALSTSDMYEELDNADVILLGPQARYVLDEVREIATPKGIPVEVINSQIYGSMNGEAVLDMALELAKRE